MDGFFACFQFTCLVVFLVVFLGWRLVLRSGFTLPLPGPRTGRAVNS